MTDQPLFVETLSEALKEAVRACGGAKKVAGQLWPEKPLEAALLQEILQGRAA